MLDVLLIRLWRRIPIAHPGIPLAGKGVKWDGIAFGDGVLSPIRASPVQARGLNEVESPLASLFCVGRGMGYSTVTDFARFLATAEAIRELAETSGAAKAPGPIMRPGEAARLPDEIAAALPAVRIDIAD